MLCKSSGLGKVCAEILLNLATMQITMINSCFAKNLPEIIINLLLSHILIFIVLHHFPSFIFKDELR